MDNSQRILQFLRRCVIRLSVSRGFISLLSMRANDTPVITGIGSTFLLLALAQQPQHCGIAATGLPPDA
jgi:hypothetical protein